MPLMVGMMMAIARETVKTEGLNFSSTQDQANITSCWVSLNRTEPLIKKRPEGRS